MPMKKLSPFLHGFIFAAGCPIIVYVAKPDNVIFISPYFVIRPAICAIGAYLLFIAIALLLTRDAEYAGMIASLLVLGFFYLWPVFAAILLLALFAVLVIRVILKRIRLRDANLVLNAISIALVGYYFFEFAGFVVRQPWESYRHVVDRVIDTQEARPGRGKAPDIYYIILDGYGRADMLQNIHGYDNSAFIAALEQRGFVVASRSQTNYPRTLLALASSLNMQYLDTMAAAMGDSYLWWPVTDTVQHSQVREFLERRGYRTVFLASGWDFTDIRDGDIYRKPYPLMLNDFEEPFVNFTNLSVLRGAASSIAAYPSYDTHRRIILYNFETLPEVAALPGPKFVFAHIVAPHPPFVFDRDGGAVDPDYPFTLMDPYRLRGDVSQSRERYLAQLTFISQQTLTMLDGVLAHSETPPVIIIQADHGPNIFVDYNSLENTCLYERFSILNAYYLPGVDGGSVSADLSPVNSFRLIFNEYFGADFTLLPDLHYYARSARFYQFEDVSGRSEAACDIPVEARP